MKFITSRIISPKKVRTLMEIANEQDELEKEAQTVTKTASTKKVTKTASAKKTKKVTKKASAEEQTAKQTETTKEVEAPKSAEAPKAVKASAEKPTNKMGVVWKQLKSEASLSTEDRSFLLEYFKKYYPADYVEALIAQY
jgi:hypothetical protein